MDVKTYLQRINYNGDISPIATTFHDLHLAHVQTVPFENLDIQLGYPIVLELPALFEKIVIRRRGGFCYELNWLFAWLLQELGFSVTLLAASEYIDEKPDIETHFLLQVECPADPLTPSTSWLSDVGYGDTFREPLRLDKLGTEQVERLHVYRIDQADGYYILWRRNHSGQWKKQLRINMRPREFPDFEPMCRYHSTSPESFFTKHLLCTLVTPGGRITIYDHKFIVTEYAKRQNRIINYFKYRSILKKQFGIDLRWLSICRITIRLFFWVFRTLVWKIKIHALAPQSDKQWR